jgi:hypothetical protein
MPPHPRSMDGALAKNPALRLAHCLANDRRPRVHRASRASPGSSVREGDQHDLHTAARAQSGGLRPMPPGVRRTTHAGRGSSTARGWSGACRGAGCSTSASTRLAMNCAVRTAVPPRVTSATVTMPRPVDTSTRRPARVASTSYVRTSPPASMTTSTRSPFMAMSTLS